MSGQGEKDGNCGFPDGLEELGDDNLSTDDREAGNANLKGDACPMGQLFVVCKHADEHLREQFAGDESCGCDDCTGHDTQFQGSFDAFKISCSIVVAADGLHTHGDSHDNHDEKERDTVHDTEGTDGQIAVIQLQSLVDEDDNEAGRYVHEERGQTDADDVFHQDPFQPIDAPVKV